MPRSRLVGTDAPRLDPLEPRQLLTVYTPTPLADVYADPPDELFSLSPPAGVETVGYGAAGATLGDVDADGADDFAIAAPGRAASGEGSAVNGYVFLYSGRTQSLLATIAGTSPGFGAVLANAGDFNNDGVSDLFVGSPASASAAFYSGSSGALLHALTGDADSEFGFSFTRTDDLNADGTADFAVGAPTQGGTGAVFTFSGADYAQLRRIDGSQAGSRYGHALATWGNLTDQVTPRDGVRELFIGVPEWDTFRDGATITAAGALVLVEPISGVHLQDYQGSNPDGHVGTSLLATEDLLRVGAPAGPATTGPWVGGWVLRVSAATAPGVWFSIVTDSYRSQVPGTRLGEWLGITPSLKGTENAMLLIGNGAGINTRSRAATARASPSRPRACSPATSTPTASPTFSDSAGPRPRSARSGPSPRRCTGRSATSTSGSAARARTPGHPASAAPRGTRISPSPGPTPSWWGRGSPRSPRTGSGSPSRP
jgi:hypothetical protein